MGSSGSEVDDPMDIISSPEIMERKKEAKEEDLKDKESKPKRKYTRKAPPKPKHKPIPVEGDADDTTAEQKKPKRKYVRKKKVLIQQEEVKNEMVVVGDAEEDKDSKKTPTFHGKRIKAPTIKVERKNKKKMKKEEVKGEDRGIKREPSLNDEEDGVEKKKMKKILIKPEDDGDDDDVDDVDDDAEKEDKEKELIKKIASGYIEKEAGDKHPSSDHDDDCSDEDPNSSDENFIDDEEGTDVDEDDDDPSADADTKFLVRTMYTDAIGVHRRPKHPSNGEMKHNPVEILNSVLSPSSYLKMDAGTRFAVISVVERFRKEINFESDTNPSPPPAPPSSPSIKQEVVGTTENQMDPEGWRILSLQTEKESLERSVKEMKKEILALIEGMDQRNGEVIAQIKNCLLEIKK